jgi:uncharacterized protein YcbK (DUF882 family)
VLACGCCALTALAAAARAEESAARGGLQATATGGGSVPPPSGTPATATPPAEDWRALLLKDHRTLWLLRDGEELRATYWSAASGFDRDQYLQICWLLRDRQANRVFPMDRKLLDVLCGVQAWLARNGHVMPIVVNSGYRTLATNRSTEGAARNSQHIIGKAADILVPGVSSVKLAGMASLFGHGGTGFYVGRGFVHVDTGDERIWIDKGRPRS